MVKAVTPPVHPSALSTSWRFRRTLRGLQEKPVYQVASLGLQQTRQPQVEPLAWAGRAVLV